MKKVVFVIIFMVSFLTLNCNALELCEMSDEYKEWLELGEERFNFEEPPYCDSSIEKTSYLGLSKYSLYSTSRSRYSSLELGYLSNIRDQKNTGSCWTFATNSCVETSARKEGLGSYDFSEKHMEYNTARYPYITESLVNPNGFNRDIDGGGNTFYASSYYFRGTGPIPESKMPFTDYNERIEDNTLPNDAPSVLIGNYDYVSYQKGVCSDESISLIKEKVMEYGSVGASIFMGTNSVDNSYYNYANGNYFYYPGDLGTNHAVNIVGWDDSISSSNFKNSPSRNGAWIVRNSWGEEFGDKGYFYVSYDDHNICTRISNYNDISKNDYDNAYSANYGLANLGLGSSMVDSLYASAKFTKKTDKTEYLDRVSFEVEKDTTYEVYLSKSNTLENNSDWIVLGTGHSSSSGVKTITFDTQEINDDYTIILKYSSPEQPYLPVLCRTNVDIYKYANISLGINQYSYNGTSWRDLGEYSFQETVDGQLIEITGCSSVIFAYTKNKSDLNEDPVDNYDINIKSIVGNSDIVYVNTSDYYTVNLELTNINNPEKITHKILDSKNVDVTNNFVLSNTIASGAVTIRFNNKVTNGKYKYVIKYENVEKSIEFNIYNVIESNVYKINDKIITISLDNSKELKKSNLIKNINSNGIAYKLLNKSGIEVTDNSSNIGTGYSLVIGNMIFKVVVIGDVSGDGKIMSNDALLISRHLVGLTSLNEYQKSASDTSKDTKIMSNDALLISRFLVGLRTEL